MLEVRGVKKTFMRGTPTENRVLKGVDLTLNPGDYVVVIGGNGAGKSTILNAIAGRFPIDKGTITIDGKDITRKTENHRAQYLSRVFQDPLIGTVGKMTIEENLALANRRGKKRGFRWYTKKEEESMFKEMLSLLDLGLEHRLKDNIGLLSGGQRQAVALLMATLQNPSVLLLDEHTAALDPKTAAKVLEIGDRLIEKKQLTTLMVTHNMRDAIDHGNRMIMMADGKIVMDVKGAEKAALTPEFLVQKFDEFSR